jgi:PKD repeat protein
MKQSLLNRCVALVAVAVTVVGCTMKEQEPPPLTGPSEFAQSLTVTVTPDVIFQDGASQSIVTANAKGPNGNPLANISLRAEISVGGVVTDFGKLSARNIVTDGNGRATVVYTAPATPTGPVVDEFRLVNIAITPLGNDFGNSVPRVTTLRLVPPSGVIIAPPDGLVPLFTFTPTSPTDHENVLFDASASEAPANNPIAQYRWDFGDGGSGSGRTTTHAFNSAGTFSVTLTLVDGFGRSRSSAQTIIVGAGATPTARFNFSPTVQSVNRDVFFNAAESTASPGRRIVNYFWNYGDGTSGNDGQSPRHAYGRAGTYVVTLTVTDDAGRTNTAQGQVTITP